MVLFCLRLVRINFFYFYFDNSHFITYRLFVVIPRYVHDCQNLLSIFSSVVVNQIAVVTALNIPETYAMGLYSIDSAVKGALSVAKDIKSCAKTKDIYIATETTICENGLNVSI